jgi:hypothetical protein
MDAWGKSPIARIGRRPYGAHVNEPQQTNEPTWAIAASLIPWIGFLAATLIAVRFSDLRSIDTSRFLIQSAPFYLGFVAAPSMLPLLVTRPGAMRKVVLGIMTATAIGAGIGVATIDDAQAGLAVLWVPYVAVPLAALLTIMQAVRSRVSRTQRGR